MVSASFDLNEDYSMSMETEFNNEPVGDQSQFHNQPETEQGNQATEGDSHHQPFKFKSRLNSSDKQQVLNSLLIKTVEGKLPHGALKKTAQEWGISTRCIGRMWSIAKQQQNSHQCYNVSTKYSNGGRKRITVDQQAIKELLMGDRSCIRDLASKLQIPKSTCHRLIKQGFMRPYTNSLHPGLTDMHKQIRLRWILSLLQGDTLESKKRYFPMYDFVHIDKKWFYQTKKSSRVYLAQNEAGQYRAASSSKFIPKVMFIGAVARPRFNSEGQCTFDGKIGIFPFTFQEPAKRSSKNRMKGIVVTKCIDKVNQKVTRKMLIEQIIPAIKDKCPKDGGNKVIYIQQDNAKAHICQEDKEWQQVFQQDEFTFILLQQPANSPDLNILDLGFSRSIQSLMHKKMPRDVDHMLNAVHEAFYELDPTTLGNVWMSLQFVMNKILKCKGGNEYNLPHINKKRMRLEGNQPTEIAAPQGAVIEAWNLIHGIANESEAEAQLEEQVRAEAEAQAEAMAYNYT